MDLIQSLPSTASTTIMSQHNVLKQVTAWKTETAHLNTNPQAKAELLH